MNNINFLGQSKFPLSSETLEFMKQMNSLTARMALVAGTNYILSGCETVGSTVTAGYVVLKGEILPFTGGALSSTVWVKSVKRAVTALGITYPDVYDTRTVEMGLGTEQVAWPFVRVETNLELAIRLDKIIEDMAGLRGIPTGVVTPFAGDFNKVPAGWEACMGQTYTVIDPKYVALYGVIGQLHGGSLGNFKLPDLRGMFVAGWHDVDADYKPVGKKGGSKEVVLTIDQMPRHSHTYRRAKEYGSASGNSTNHPDGPLDSVETTEAGGGKGHENRPPYYSLIFMIKL